MHSIPDIDEPFQPLEDASDISYCKFLQGDLPLVTHTHRERETAFGCSNTAWKAWHLSAV